jgi:hypothetical protein
MGVENMTYETAIKLTGKQPIWALKNMVRALQMCPWLNTEIENQRLEAGKILLKGKFS